MKSLDDKLICEQILLHESQRLQSGTRVQSIKPLPFLLPSSICYPKRCASAGLQLHNSWTLTSILQRSQSHRPLFLMNKVNLLLLLARKRQMQAQIRFKTSLINNNSLNEIFLNFFSLFSIFQNYFLFAGWKCNHSWK